MTALYDVPGPRSRRRVLVGSIVATVALAAVVFVALRRLASFGHLDAERWEQFTDWGVQRYLLLGLGVTLRVAVVAITFSAVIGVVFGLGRLSRNLPLRWLATAYVQFFRSVPLLVLILFAALGLPKYGVNLALTSYLIIGLSLYNGAVIAEIVRAGVLSLDRGQREAALTVGLTERQAMRFVVLPQAFRRMLPALVAQFVTILKDTSLGFIIGVEELLRRSQITGEYYGILLQAAFVAAAMYILVNLALSRLARRLEARQRRRLGTGGISLRDNEELAVLGAGEPGARR